MKAFKSILVASLGKILVVLLIASCGTSVNAARQDGTAQNSDHGAAAGQLRQISVKSSDPGSAGKAALAAPGKGLQPPASTNGSVDAHQAGLAHYGAKRYKEAVEAFRRALRVKPNDAKLQYDLGMAYYNLNRFKDAAETYERAVKLKSGWDEAHYRLGCTYYVLGRRKPALEQHGILQKLNPELAKVLSRILSVETMPAAPSSNAASQREGAPKITPAAPATPARFEKDDSYASLIVKSTGANVEMTWPPATEAETPATASQATTTPPVKNAPAQTTKTTAQRAPAATPAPAGEASLTDIYRIGIGDVLDIRLTETETASSTLFTVLTGGLLEYPLAGAAVQVAGMTTNEVSARLAVELKRRAVSENPKVWVSVRDYASHNVTVKGLVGNPGTMALRREAVPLYVVLAEAHPQPAAARVVITRAGEQKSPWSIEFTDQPAMNTLVQHGDVISVLERLPQFYFIGGWILAPGQKPFQKGITLMQAVLAAGGVSRATSNVVELSREGADKRLTTSKFSLKEIKAGKVPDPRLQPGDLIEIRK